MRKKDVEFFKLMTEAGERLGQENNVWSEYPRPQLVRENWQSLNGLWELDGMPIKVPFVPQADLSGYKGTLKGTMVYRKSFRWISGHPNRRVLLHFGAVDQIAEVYLNDVFLGRHAGGYAPFSFDVTEVITEGGNILKVKVTDELNQDYPYGKQCKKRGGMWYTPTSGIWQSVWLEQVPKEYIQEIKLTPDLCGVLVELFCEKCGVPVIAEAEILLHTGDRYHTVLKEGKGYINLCNIVLKSGERYVPKLWSPEAPFLYNMLIRMGEDEIKTYFGLRVIEIKDVQGVQRVCLNGKPIFMHGVLDQGYFCDGIITPAEETEYERDILRMKELGINFLRKHIKIEPECFYYYCDKHGMLVMQDMVSNGYYSFVRDTVLPTIGLQRKKDQGRRMNALQKEFFETHMKETQKQLFNHPAIVAYTIFNEGWGQFESDRLYNMAKEADPTRLYDATSGWFAQKDSDFDSIHIYFGPRKPKVKKRPVFLSEFGGYSYLVPEHVYTNKSYGYGTCKSSEDLFDRLEARYEELVLPYIKVGLCGSIYTQISDVEDEINGLYTYDRKVCKVPKTSMQCLAARIYDEIEGE